MARGSRFPNYPARPHTSGQARVRLPGAKSHTYLGVFGSPASWAEYNRLLTEWRTSGGGRAEGQSPPSGPVRTVADLVFRYLAHLETDATPEEQSTNADAVRPLVRQHGHTAVAEFGPRALRACLEAAASGSWLTAEEKAERRRAGNPITWSRNYANRNLSRWKRIWRWGESQELIPAGSWHSMQAVAGLKRGQARETEEVSPVSDEVIALVLPRLGPVTRAAVELLLLTGARPSELLKLTPAGLNRTGVVEVARGVRVKLGGLWAYQPAAHKTAYRGHRRVILFGPKAQAILAPFLDGRDPAAPLFSAAEAEADRRRRMRAARKTPVQPSQRDRSRPGARKPGGSYTVASLRRALEWACKKAGVEPFGPYRLRHSAATRLAAEFGPELARIVLGHRDLRTTAIYVMEDYAKAAQAVERTG